MLYWQEIFWLVSLQTWINNDLAPAGEKIRSFAAPWPSRHFSPVQWKGKNRCVSPCFPAFGCFSTSSNHPWTTAWTGKRNQFVTFCFEAVIKLFKMLSGPTIFFSQATHFAQNVFLQGNNKLNKHISWKFFLKIDHIVFCDAKVEFGDVVLFCTFALFHVHVFIWRNLNNKKVLNSTQWCHLTWWWCSW